MGIIRELSFSREHYINFSYATNYIDVSNYSHIYGNVCVKPSSYLLVIEHANNTFNPDEKVGVYNYVQYVTDGNFHFDMNVRGDCVRIKILNLVIPANIRCNTSGIPK